MFDFGVTLRENADGSFTALLVDLPDGPQAQGSSSVEAYQNLIRTAGEAMTVFLKSGKEPAAITDETDAFISIGLPVPIPQSPPAALPVDAAKPDALTPRDQGGSLNYGWRNNTTIRGG